MIKICIKITASCVSVPLPAPGQPGMCSPALPLSGEAPDTFSTCLGTGEMRAGTIHPCLS